LLVFFVSKRYYYFMSYKAVILDLDGTAIANEESALPSERLINIIQKIKNQVQVCVATGRPLFNCREIIKKLQLTAPCIISGGTQILEPVSGKIIWEKLLSVEQIKAVLKIVKPFAYRIFFSDEKISVLAKDKLVTKPENILFIIRITREDTDFLIKALRKIPNIAAHEAPSWTPNRYCVHVTHQEATKQHALEILFERLKVKPDEVIGFGDAPNDIPIFQAVGYKVAMDNGSVELKKLADRVEPNEDNEGVARVLEEIFL